MWLTVRLLIFPKAENNVRKRLRQGVADKQDRPRVVRNEASRPDNLGAVPWAPIGPRPRRAQPDRPRNRKRAAACQAKNVCGLLEFLKRGGWRPAYGDRPAASNWPLLPPAAVQACMIGSGTKNTAE